jgi:Sec-independent protein translocase protein TatA
MIAAFRTFLVLLGASLVAAPALASDMMIYKEGVSDEQKQKDRFECQNWATQQTGFDPLNPPTVQAPEVSAAPSQQATEGGAVRGAARGAATGAVVGAIAGDAGKGAAAGAAGGALVGRMRRRDAEQQQQAQQQAAQQQQQAAVSQQQQAIEQQRAQFNRAISTCLQGRGYTVN